MSLAGKTPPKILDLHPPKIDIQENLMHKVVHSGKRT